MAILAVSNGSRAGVDLTGVAVASGGDSFPNTGHEYLVIDNGNAAEVTVTLDIRASVDGQAVPDRTVAVPTGKVYAIGPFPVALYNDNNGRANFSCAPYATVNAKVIKV